MGITARNYQRYYMPSTSSLPKEEQTWVVYDTSPVRPSDSFEITDFDNPAVRLCKVMVNRIQDWNYNDTDGGKAEITWQNVGDIPQVDLDYLSSVKLSEVAAELTDTEKKS